MGLDLTVLPGFVLLILLFLLPPGPDMVYMIAVGLQGGRRAAIRAILGIGTGMAIYAASVVVGLGSVVAKAPLLLDLIKLAGALYLLWLAFDTLRTTRRSPTTPHAGPDSHHYYVRGLIVALTNPKLVLFFIAVLPQFIGNATSPATQLAMLGLVNVLMEMLLYGSIGLAAGTAQASFATSPKALRYTSYLAAAVYVALAGFIVVETFTAHAS